MQEASLGFQPIKVDIPKINVTRTEVQVQHSVLSHIAAAAESLGLAIMRDTAETGLSLLNAISQTKFNETLAPLTVDPDKYAEALQGHLLEMQDRPEKMEKELSKQQMADEEIVEISDEEEELCSATAKISEQSSEGEGCVAVGGKELSGVKEGDGGATSGSHDRVLTSAGVREGDGGATSGSQDDVATSASVW